MFSFAPSQVLKDKLGSDVVIEMDTALDAAAQQWMRQVVETAVATFERRLTEEISGHRMEMVQRFDQIDSRFHQIDGRFQQIDGRFEKIDKRFEKIDERFEKMDSRFDKVDDRLYSLSCEIATQFRWTIGVMITLVAGMLAAILTR